MKTEIKMYLLTKHLYVFYGTSAKVIEQLQEIIGESELWHLWIERFQQISESQELQIMLMRNAGMTYRKIQQLLAVSPGTVKNTLERFTLDYDILGFPEEFDDQIKLLEKRMQAEGVELW